MFGQDTLLCISLSSHVGLGRSVSNFCTARLVCHSFIQYNSVLSYLSTSSPSSLSRRQLILLVMILSFSQRKSGFGLRLTRFEVGSQGVVCLSAAAWPIPMPAAVLASGLNAQTDTVPTRMHDECCVDLLWWMLLCVSRRWARFAEHLLRCLVCADCSG